MQRNGRVIRQGNTLFEKDPENFKIKEFRYITENTYDAVSWQIIETKSKSLINFRKGLVDSRTLSGFEEEAASAAEMKAAATRNPLILDQVKLKSALDREEISFKSYQNNIINAQDTIEINKKRVEYQQKLTENFKMAKEILENNQSENFRCSIFDIPSQTYKNFEISKDKNDDLTKTKQDELNLAFMKNFKDIIRYEIKDIEMMKYKGFIINGGYNSNSKTIDFNISDQNNKFVFSPENLIYSLKENNLFLQFSFTGFIKRLNNFLNSENFDKLTQNSAQNIEKLNQNSKDLKIFLQENNTYKNQEKLELLRDENKIVMSELEKSSLNPNYKSKFRSKFLQMQNEPNIVRQKVEIKENSMEI